MSKRGASQPLGFRVLLAPIGGVGFEIGQPPAPDAGTGMLTCDDG
jgi:hypothetical protein